MLDSLIDRAKDSSTEKRKQVVEHVTNLFVTRGDKKKPEEIELYNSMLEGMVDTLDAETKKEMAERLASVDETSSALAQRLASDDIDIARPILERSKSLSPADLHRLARIQSQKHLLAIAKRDQIDQPLTKVLLERGDKDVKQSVATNLGADISPEDFEKLVKDLPKQLGEKIRHLRKSNEELIHDLFDDSDDAAIGSRLVPKPARISAMDWLQGIRLGRATVGKAVSQMAFEKDLFGAAFTIGVISGLDQKYVNNLMVRFDATGIATVCRSIGLDAAEYSTVCKARCAHLKFPVSTGNKWLTNYHMLDHTDATRLVALMKMKLKAMERAKAA